MTARIITTGTSGLDAEVLDFVERTLAYYPSGSDSASIAEARAVYDRMCHGFNAGRPPGLTIEDRRPDDELRVPVRIYTPDDPRSDTIVVYMHGGGFVLGGLESHDDICAEIAVGTKLRLVSVDYRLAPEHPHPAAYEDGLAACRWVRSSFGSPTLLCGDSAGGNLAAAVTHALRGTPDTPVGQVLIYPGLGGAPDKGSYVEHAEAPLLTTDDVIQYEALRSGGADLRDDPSFAPLAAADLTDTPPTIIFSAGCDPLCNDGRDYRDRILAAGGRAHWIAEDGLVHGYLRARTMSSRARESFARIKQAIVDLASERSDSTG